MTACYAYVFSSLFYVEILLFRFELSAQISCESVYKVYLILLILTKGLSFWILKILTWEFMLSLR